MMTTLLILFSFIGSVSFTLMLRRLDRSNLKLNQIRRFGENQSTQIEEMSARQIRMIKDATIEFELLFRQSHQQREEIESGLSDYSTQLDHLKKEREAVRGISDDLEQISKSSSAVLDHVDRLDAGLARLSLAEREMNDVHDRIEHLSQIVEQRGIDSETKLSQITGRIIRENEERGMRLAEGFETVLDDMRDKVVAMDDQLTERKRDYELVGERINTLSTRLDEKWILEAGRIDDKFGGIEKRLQERFLSLESGLAAIRTSSVESLQAEVSRIRSEIEGFNLSTLAKRDEILNETRRMAEGISDQIRLFQEKSIETENRLLKFAEQEKHSIRERIASYDEEWSGMEERHMDELDERVRGLEELINRNRDSRIESLQLEYHKTREDFRTLAKNLREEIQNDADGIQRTIGEAMREEEKSLLVARNELERLREEMSEAGREANASVRGECDHSISLIRETRIAEIEALNRSRDELLRARNDVYERLEGLEVQMREAARLHQKLDDHVVKIKEELVDAGESILSDLDGRASKILSEQDVKLEKLGRAIDDGISRHLAHLIDSGQLKIDELEKRTTEMLRGTTSRMEEDLQRARDEFRRMRESVGEEMEKARLLRDDILQEISKDSLRLQKFQDRLEVVNQAELLVQRLDEAVEILTDRLDLAREENSKMDGYMKNLEAVRLTRQELENEIRRLDEQKEKLVETERNIRAVEVRVEGLHAKFESLVDGEALAGRIEEKAEKLSAYKETF
jgi:chromosome segregation ATPase